MLRNVLAVAGILAFVAIAVLGGAVLTGYIVVDDPGVAAAQILSGEFEDPDVGAEEVELGPVGAPQGSIQDVGTDGATFRNEFYVDNPNHLGGTVSLIEYDVYLAGSRGGPYEFLGSGAIEGLEVPPNGTVTESNEFDVEYDDFLRAMGISATGALDGTWYARIEGEATIDLGPVSFSIEFEEIEEIEP